MAIYLKTDTEIKSIRDIVEYMSAKRSMKSMFNWGSPRTYKDPEFSETQCIENRLRSFDDMLEACQTYFPETTEKDLMIELQKDIIIDGRTFGFYPLFCSDINKSTFLYEYKDFGKPNIPDSVGVSKHSWKELYEMIE